MMPNKAHRLRPSAEWDLQDLVLSIAGEDIAATFYTLLDADNVREGSGESRVGFTALRELYSHPSVSDK
jgi:hypothetical protein